MRGVFFAQVLLQHAPSPICFNRLHKHFIPRGHQCTAQGAHFKLELFPLKIKRQPQERRRGKSGTKKASKDLISKGQHIWPISVSTHTYSPIKVYFDLL